MATGNRGRDLAVPFDPAVLASLRATLAEARGLPGPYREVLLDELSLLLDASRRHLAAVRPRGALTRRGAPLAALKAYAALQARLERVAGMLGLDEPGKVPEPTFEERKADIQRAVDEAKRRHHEEP